jgi:hypothetical protein
VIIDNFGLGGEELLEVVRAEPISIFSRLKCWGPLPDGSIPLLRRRIRLLYFLSKIEIGERIEFDKLHPFLCEVCEQGLHHCLDEEHRARRLVLKAGSSSYELCPSTNT